MRTNLLILLLIVGFYTSYAQKKVVAVMPFVAITPETKGAAAALQSAAIQIFSTNANITLVDRSADPLVLQELNNQIREESISSKTLIQQGKITGAEEIIVGTLNSISIDQKGDKFSASLSYTLQIDDAETGTMISTKSFSGNTGAQDISHKVLSVLGGAGGAAAQASSMIMSDTKDAAMQNAISNTKKQIALWIKEAYPSNIKLLSVDSRDGKGFPSTLTLGGFKEAQASKGVIVNEVSYIESDGTKYRKVKKVAELKITSIQGEIVEAKVRDGGELLEEKMKGGAKFQFVLN